MKLQKLLTTMGSSLLALYFLVPGVLKFVAWSEHIEMMQQHQLPMPTLLLALAGLTQITTALFILFKRHVAWAALYLALLTLAINLGMHDFWNYEGVTAQHETQNFIKNLGIFAGLLLLSASNWPIERK